MNHPATTHTICDFLIIGSGAAGLLAATLLAPHGRVIIVNKGEFADSNTYRAQGGIAAVADFGDSVEAHTGDTLQAGAGLCHEDVVRHVIGRSPEMIRQLVELGVDFDQQNGQLHLTQEGGHSYRRIAHAKDATGKSIGKTLLRQISDQPNVVRLERHTAIDLITEQRLGRSHSDRDHCLGAYLLTPDDKVITVAAAHTILATGGAGKVYSVTTNPHASTGDGIAMAWRAGCPVMNLEFMQFHPTCLYRPSGSTLLLTEALRGEGAHLIDAEGRRFVFDYDERGELAPRDIVARAIDHEMKKRGADHMFLDARHLGEKVLSSHFPNVYASLLALSLDMVRQPIPVVPAAHYMCGGVKTDVAGRTPIGHLYVIGESACTGLHGANRLASNSLLECMVMADECAADIRAQPPVTIPSGLPAWDASGVVPETERVQIKQNWDEIRATMSNYVGIVRSNERLRRARRRLSVISEEITAYYWQHPLSRDLIELRNLSLVAELVVRSAQTRRESRGLHYSTDYPGQLPEATDTVLTPGNP